MALSIYPSVYYQTADGNEIPISTPSTKKYWEVYGREGFGVPELKTETRIYADGSVRTLTAIIQPREMLLNMILVGETTEERDNLYRDISSHLVQVGSTDEWGRLRLRRSDGNWIFINCLYTGGMDTPDNLPTIRQFSMEFFADDPYFYDAEETVFQPKQLSQLIYLNDNLFLGDWTLKGGLTDLQIHNTGELCFPVIEVTGPASVIRIKNETTKQTLAMATDFSLAMGEVLLIDCREHQQRGITLRDSTGREQDITNKLGLGSSLNWPLVKGTNVISLYYTDSAQTSSYRLRFRKRYYSA